MSRRLAFVRIRTLPVLSRTKCSFTYSCLSSILDSAYLIEVVRVRKQLGCLSDAFELVIISNETWNERT